MAAVQQQLQALSGKFQSIQQSLQTTIESRQKLESQSQENQSVQAEFDALDDDSNIYKLIGPVLVKQDPLEAKQNVARRIELLKEETKRVEEEIKKRQAEAEACKAEIIQIQQDNLAQEQKPVEE